MPKVTQAHRDARRQQIVAAARAAFAEKGFAQTSTGDIIARSGLSNGAVYTYFGSKNDIVQAVCGEAIDTMLGDESVRDLSGLLDRLRGIDGGIDHHARLVAQIWAEATVSPTLAALLRQQLQRVHERTAEFLRQARADSGLPALPDLDQSAEVLLTLLIGYLQRVAVDDHTGSEALLRAIQAMAVPER